MALPPAQARPRRHRIRDWRPGKISEGRRTVFRKAHRFHKKTGARVALHVEYKGQLFVYYSDPRPAPEFVSIVQQLRQDIKPTPLDTLEFPPPPWHVVSRLLLPGHSCTDSRHSAR